VKMSEEEISKDILSILQISFDEIESWKLIVATAFYFLQSVSSMFLHS
jgi:hypothetical protein